MPIPVMSLIFSLMIEISCLYVFLFHSKGRLGFLITFPTLQNLLHKFTKVTRISTFFACFPEQLLYAQIQIAFLSIFASSESCKIDINIKE